MTFKKKRRSKKMAKLFAWLTLATFVLYVALMVAIITLPILVKSNKAAVFIVTIPIMTMIVLWFVSMNSAMTRGFYLKKIKEWRERRFFQITVEHILAGDLQGSFRYYESIPQGLLRDYLYAVIIFTGHTSDDQELAEKCRQRIKSLREKFAPETVKF